MVPEECVLKSGVRKLSVMYHDTVLLLLRVATVGNERVASSLAMQQCCPLYVEQVGD